MMILSLAACGGNSTSSDANSTKNGGGEDGSKSNYPEKPITFVVPTGAGGGLDTTTRALTKVLTNFLNEKAYYDAIAPSL